MTYPEKRCAKLARWLAARQMQLEQERIAQLDGRPAPQFGTPRMFPAGPLEFFNSMPARIDGSAASAPAPRQALSHQELEEIRRRQRIERMREMKQCANEDCSRAYSPTFPDRLGDDPGDVFITSVNDEKDKPSTNVPIHPITVETVTQAVRDAGLQHVNINSTYRKPVPNEDSRHFSAQAVDINRINGMRVDDPANAANVAALQAALDRQPHIRENFGPYIVEKTTVQVPGSFAVKEDWSYKKKLVDDHKDHIHASTHKQRPKPPPPAPRLKPRRMP